jgi:hypothetical protein
VIDVDVSAGQLLALGAGAAEGEILDVPQLPPGTSGSTAIGIAERYVPVPPPVEHAAPSVSEGLAQVAEPPPAAVPQANAAAPLGPQVPPPGSSPLVVDEDEGELVPEAPPVVPAAAPPAPPAPAPVPPPAPATPDAGEMLAEAMANNAQRRLLWATVRGRGITEEQLRGILQDVTGQESTAHIPARLFDAVVTAVQGAPAPTQEAT